MAKKNQQAKKMATAGKSAAQIKAKTGVGSQTAQKYVAKQAPAPAPAPKPAPKPASNSSSNSSRSTPEIKGLAQGLRVAGKGGLSKSEFNTIAETTGKSNEEIVGKLDKINTKLETKDKAGIGLSSGTANMLINKAQNSSPKTLGYKPISFGEGAIGSTLQSMIPTPANAGTWYKGALINSREGDPGFNPGGSPDENRMIGGTVLRPNGGIAVKGAGEQYELPKRFKAPKEEGPYDGMEIGPPDLKGPGPLANPNTDTWLGYKDPDDDDGNDPTLPTGPEIKPEPEEKVDRSASSGAGGLDLASWATGFRKARSARQKSGRNAQGLASQKKNPFKSWA
jgi:hypothetical protein